jgi:AcrR family transcriptional regulator
MGHTAQRARLSRQEWIAAAMAMGVRLGFDGLAVEPLAAELNTTKGSFYWHFKDRADLLDAVLADWEQRATTQIIEDVDRSPSDERLAGLVAAAFGRSFDDEIEWQILAAAHHPRVGPVVVRVHDARLAYLRRLFQARGLTVARARARARVAYAAYLGHLQLMMSRPNDPPKPAAIRAYVDELVALFTAP